MCRNKLLGKIGMISNGRKKGEGTIKAKHRFATKTIPFVTRDHIHGRCSCRRMS
jgi:hypothetical protein